MRRPPPRACASPAISAMRSMARFLCRRICPRSWRPNARFSRSSTGSPPPRRYSRPPPPRSWPGCFHEGPRGRRRAWPPRRPTPPHLTPLVELAGAPWTAPAIIAKAKAIYEAAGQTPIAVKREIDGFTLNRLQAVLLSEAFRLVGDGYVTPQDLDKTLKDGLGLRWSFMGPFETIQ